MAALAGSRHCVPQVRGRAWSLLVLQSVVSEETELGALGGLEINSMFRWGGLGSLFPLHGDFAARTEEDSVLPHSQSRVGGL